MTRCRAESLCRPDAENAYAIPRTPCLPAHAYKRDQFLLRTGKRSIACVRTRSIAHPDALATRARVMTACVLQLHSGRRGGVTCASVRSPLPHTTEEDPFPQERARISLKWGCRRRPPRPRCRRLRMALSARPPAD